VAQWLKKECLVCGRTFKYPSEGYKPSTCDSHNCTHKYLHNPDKYKSLAEFVSECRQKVNL